MKVYIGPYKRWWGPYQIADLIPFISEDTAYKIGGWLAKTPLNDLCNWIDSKKERKVKIRIDKYDTWNMDDTLAHIILPMLKQLKETKQGSPMVDDEDVPPHMRHSDPDPENFGADNWVHYKWEWVLNEMIWTFENILDNEWESKYTIEEGELDFDDYPEDEGKECTPVRWKKPYVIDWDGREAHQNRVTNGLKLFGKYYQGLWD